MSLLELIIIAVGLSMDAFAVSLCKGLCMRKPSIQNAAVIALSFGFFQAAMPLLGWFLGKQFTHHISQFDHWIAFVLLALIGGKMIHEALRKNKEVVEKCDLPGVRELLLLSIATSIDALAAGVTFAFLQVVILPAVLLIGLITVTVSFIGVEIGHRFGSKLQDKAELSGGFVLILIGTKILIDHLSGSG